MVYYPVGDISTLNATEIAKRYAITKYVLGLVVVVVVLYSWLLSPILTTTGEDGVTSGNQLAGLDSSFVCFV